MSMSWEGGTAARRARVISIDSRDPEPRFAEWAEYHTPTLPPEAAEENPERGLAIGILAGAVAWGVLWGVVLVLRLLTKGGS
jgi:hypothetical protein